MLERSAILRVYRNWITERWRDGLITFEEVHGLKVFCEVHHLTVKEHQTVVEQLGLDRRKLVDDNNQPFAEWLRMRRSTLPRGSGTLPFKPPERVSPWRSKLPARPSAWQNALAGLAGIAIVASVAVLLFVR